MRGRGWGTRWFGWRGFGNEDGWEGRGAKERGEEREECDEIRQRIGFGLFAPWPAALHTVARHEAALCLVNKRASIKDHLFILYPFSLLPSQPLARFTTRFLLSLLSLLTVQVTEH